MMVKLIAASVTSLTVLGVLEDMSVTDVTVKLEALCIELVLWCHFILSSMLCESLQSHGGICWITCCYDCCRHYHTYEA